ncbi:hypothetical protein B0H19DRAFT_1071607 [Mycena capillaripes]|nr:hypothetical protein B0H19DRAFT_1071607 [Mycena capillaripes]
MCEDSNRTTPILNDALTIRVQQLSRSIFTFQTSGSQQQDTNAKLNTQEGSFTSYEHSCHLFRPPKSSDCRKPPICTGGQVASHFPFGNSARKEIIERRICTKNGPKWAQTVPRMHARLMGSIQLASSAQDGYQQVKPPRWPGSPSQIVSVRLKLLLKLNVSGAGSERAGRARVERAYPADVNGMRVVDHWHTLPDHILLPTHFIIINEEICI